jgi:hypothetical protein
MSRQLYKSYTGGIGGYKPHYPIPKFQTTPEPTTKTQKIPPLLAQNSEENDLCVKLFSKLIKDSQVSRLSFEIDNIQYFGEKEIETVSFRVLKGLPQLKEALTKAKIPFVDMSGSGNYWIIIEADDIHTYLNQGKSI